MTDDTRDNRQTRRDFLKTAGAAATSALAGFSIVSSANAQGADQLKVGLIGCGGRGTGAAENCLNADSKVRVVALADLFQDRIDKCRTQLSDPNRKDGALPGSGVLLGFFCFRLFFTVGHVRAFGRALAAGQSLHERPQKKHAAGNNDCRDDRYRNDK